MFSIICQQCGHWDGFTRVPILWDCHEVYCFVDCNAHIFVDQQIALLFLGLEKNHCNPCLFDPSHLDAGHPVLTCSERQLIGPRRWSSYPMFTFMPLFVYLSRQFLCRIFICWCIFIVIQLVLCLYVIKHVKTNKLALQVDWWSSFLDNSLYYHLHYQQKQSVKSFSFDLYI